MENRKREGVKASGRMGEESGSNISVKLQLVESNPFVLFDGAAKHMLVMKGVDMSAAGSTCLFSLLF